MVGQRYLLAKPQPPSALKRQFDQEVLPAAINMAASVEAVVERIARHARRQPLATVGAAFGLAFTLSLFAGPARSVAARRAGFYL